MALIYKIATAQQWREAEAAGRFVGAPVDLADGFIHFSTAETVQETADKHFARQDGLILAAVDADDFGDLLKWEVSRGGALFPHLYRELDMKEVKWAKALPLRNGKHDFTGLLP
jgi:uncharacterized protein (DUF952 family)